MNLSSLLDQYESVADDATPMESARPPHLTPQSPARGMITPYQAPPPALSEHDLQSMIGEARRDVRLQEGLIGQVMQRLRGNPMQRRQYATMVRRIEAYDMAEEGRLALFLVLSLQALGMELAMGALQAMEDMLGRYQHGSAAHRVGTQMLLDNEQRVPAMVNDIQERTRRHTLRSLNLDR